MTTIRVTATAADQRCVLWERDAAHPGGECFVVADGKVYEVGDTALVRSLVREGRLVLTPALEQADERGVAPDLDAPARSRKAK